MKPNNLKYDDGKAPIMRGFMDYFPNAVEFVAHISKFGFEKYKSWGGWLNVEDGFNRYNDGLGRHTTAHAKGEERCPESQMLHLAHRARNAMATLELYVREHKATVLPAPDNKS